MCDPSSNHSRRHETGLPKLLGLVPAAGNASRISPLPLSKELFPVGFHRLSADSQPVPKPVCLNLLEAMRLAGVTEAYIVLRPGKWDIPAYLGCGQALDMNLGYLIMDLPHGVPFTLEQAYPFIGDATVLFGFPDILVQPKDVFVQLLEKQSACSADVVLGLFPAINPEKNDMVALDEHRRVSRIEIKPRQTDLRYTWINAVWSHAFTCFLHDFINHRRSALPAEHQAPKAQGIEEIFIGDVVQSALKSDLKIESVIFETGRYIDIGTPEDMNLAIQRYTQKAEI